MNLRRVFLYILIVNIITVLVIYFTHIRKPSSSVTDFREFPQQPPHNEKYAPGVQDIPSSGFLEHAEEGSAQSTKHETNPEHTTAQSTHEEHDELNYNDFDWDDDDHWSGDNWDDDEEIDWDDDDEDTYFPDGSDGGEVLLDEIYEEWDMDGNHDADDSDFWVNFEKDSLEHGDDVYINDADEYYIPDDDYAGDDYGDWSSDGGEIKDYGDYVQAMEDYTEKVDELLVEEKKMNSTEILGIKAQLLKELFHYGVPEEHHYNNALKSSKDFGKLGHTIRRNPEYCEQSDRYFLEHPEEFFQKSVIFSDYKDDSLVRLNAIKAIGTDAEPSVPVPKRDLQQERIALPLNISMYILQMQLHQNYRTSTEFLCYHQTYNALPGHGVLARKDLLVQTLNAYSKIYAKRPECFNQTMFFPKSFWLMDKDECQEAFRILKSPEYQREKEKTPIQFIRKKGLGAHRGLGVRVVDNEEEADILRLWDNGKKCGHSNVNNYVLQTYVANPLLLDGHKFDFRIYLLISSTNPMIAFYHDGFLRVSLEQYDINSKDVAVHLTNTEISKEKFRQAEAEGKSSEELRNFQMWNLTRFTNYLVEKGKVKDASWLDTHLRHSFKRAFAHMTRMIKDHVYSDSRVFELFGVDFILDQDLNLWLLEVNSNPSLQGSSAEKEKHLTKMMKDIIEIEYAYLRSRVQRGHTYLDELVQQILKRHGDMLTEDELAEARSRFEMLNRNFIEDGVGDFQISKDNGFVKIVDENYEAEKGYFGLLDSSCFEEEEEVKQSRPVEETIAGDGDDLQLGWISITRFCGTCALSVLSARICSRKFECSYEYIQSIHRR
eukprot:TRINITY_DN4832_c0_g1_i7.p1 TRINITY_DN4832_c0_g1~~TRINITY_DN4832_c0_g1_i7.p1  ORF type:complete len:829 (+),score=209.15 TRINITY_DN4832_c0_g1_i7:129-2615(+)